ncbi:MAG: hypothetical protein ACRDK0_10020 [Solirubrobacteraceae bacterium]
MRKTLIGAVAALTALALAAVAIAQNPAPVVDVTAKVSPAKAGTKKKPKSETVDLVIQNSEESKSSASKIEIQFPKTLRLATKGLRTCSVATLDGQGKAACPAKSRAGRGSAKANLNPYATTPAPLFFSVTAFVAGKNKLAFFLEQTDSENGNVLDDGVQQALPATIAKRGSGQKLTINIPENLQQPAPNTYSALLEIKNDLGLKSGKNALLKSVGCPRSREHKIGVKITYVPNPTPPARSSVTSTDGAACSGKP